ncbi:NUDIX domain-containing protein [uncultured Lactobacillus sp.]|uniref:bis(5'-nucleosyl)-tetraphosphatase n=1 Tax=uncultured Lactobacillus sp. TaxID=153152 RepID=UPI00261CD511|nr:NUDIX domain-containing protein [uncultured Lactobacillus sp.]
MKMEHSAGAVIYRERRDEELEYLIVQSVVNHNWGFPKGHLENNETAEEAAKREVFEEVDLKPNFDFAFKAQTEYQLTADKAKTVVYFVASYVAGQEVKTQKEEILASKWVSLAEAKQYLTVHEKMAVLTKAQNYIEQ